MLKSKGSTSSAPVFAINHGHPTKKKKVSHPKIKGKAKEGMASQGLNRNFDYDITPTTDPKEAIYFYC